MEEEEEERKRWRKGGEDIERETDGWGDGGSEGPLIKLRRHMMHQPSKNIDFLCSPRKGKPTHTQTNSHTHKHKHTGTHEHEPAQTRTHASQANAVG